MPVNALRIVIADDNHDSAESMAMVLTLWGHDVSVCNRPDKTIDCCIKHWPDVILLDIGFPTKNDGLGIAKELRKWHKLRDAAIIAVTGYCDQITRDLAMEADFDHYMVKPVDFDEMKQILALIKPEKEPRNAMSY